MRAVLLACVAALYACFVLGSSYPLPDRDRFLIFERHGESLEIQAQSPHVTEGDSVGTGGVVGRAELLDALIALQLQDSPGLRLGDAETLRSFVDSVRKEMEVQDRVVAAFMSDLSPAQAALLRKETPGYGGGSMALMISDLCYALLEAAARGRLPISGPALTGRSASRPRSALELVLQVDRVLRSPDARPTVAQAKRWAAMLGDLQSSIDGADHARDALLVSLSDAQRGFIRAWRSSKRPSLGSVEERDRYELLRLLLPAGSTGRTGITAAGRIVRT